MRDVNGGITDDQASICSNFENALRVVGKEMEALRLHHSQTVVASLTWIMTGVSQCLQRERPTEVASGNRKRPEANRSHQV